jgi:hypothetical protein
MGTGAVTEPPPFSLRVSDFEEVGGTSYLAASVTQLQGEQFASSGSYGDTRTRNLIFLDRLSLQSHRLFETNQQVILNIDHLGRGNKANPAPTTAAGLPVKWLMYRVVSADTNQDGRLDAKDTFALGVSDAFGLGYVVVVLNVSRVLAISMIGEDQVLVALESEGVLQASLIDLPTKAIAVSHPLVGVTGATAAPAN